MPRLKTYLSLVQTHGPLSQELFVDLNGTVDVLTLRLLVYVLIVKPSIAMRCNLPVLEVVIVNEVMR